MDGKIRSISGFSQKKEEMILKKIKIYRLRKNKFLLGDVYPLAKQIEKPSIGVRFCQKGNNCWFNFTYERINSNIDYLVVSDMNLKKLLNRLLICRKLKRF